MSTRHRCMTEDGVAILCLCVRGVDHDESEFDVPLDRPDVIAAIHRLAQEAP